RLAQRTHARLVMFSARGDWWPAAKAGAVARGVGKLWGQGPIREWRGALWGRGSARVGSAGGNIGIDEITGWACVSNGTSPDANTFHVPVAVSPSKVRNVKAQPPAKFRGNRPFV